MLLHESWTKALAQQPETGMGFQVLLLRGTYQLTEYAIVLNGSYVPDSVVGFRAVGEDTPMVAEAEMRSALREPAGTVHFRVLSRPEAVKAGLLARSAIADRPASEAPVGDSDMGERFLRFSAFPNDVRIVADGSVIPGTYVTTFEDGMNHVTTGRDAVRRYALPNPDPAVHRYHLMPPRMIPVRRGVVQPAFGQPGGGAEVIFEKGAPAGTRQLQDQIPPG